MIRTLLALVFFLISPWHSYAAFISTDDFDGYSLSADLNTLNGGTNWAAAWADIGGGAMTIETAPAGGQGGKAVRSNSATANTQYRRTYSAITAGTVGFRMRTSISNPDDFVGVVLLETTTTGRMYVRFGPTGNIEIYNHTGATYESLGAYSVDTWYTVEIDFDDAAQPELYRARINGGSYSAYKTVNGGAYTDINALMIEDSATNAHTFWLDDIGLAGTPESASARRAQPMFFQ